MPRVDLNVPFAEKDAAKKLGAKWDPGARVWYVPADIDLTPFARWLRQSDVIEPNVRSKWGYFIAQAPRTCWKCSREIKVFGLLMPPGHEVYADQFDEDADNETMAWQVNDEHMFIDRAEFIPQSALVRLGGLGANMKRDRDGIWMNHCPHCGAKQGDFKLLYEPGDAFFPTCPEEAARILLHPVLEPFAGDTKGISSGLHYAEEMTISKDFAAPDFPDELLTVEMEERLLENGRAGFEGDHVPVCLIVDPLGRTAILLTAIDPEDEGGVRGLYCGGSGAEMLLMDLGKISGVDGRLGYGLVVDRDFDARGHRMSEFAEAASEEYATLRWAIAKVLSNDGGVTLNDHPAE